MAISAIVALTALCTLPGAAADGTSSVTVIASADAYVTSSDPSANFGSAADLRIDNAPNDKSQARVLRSYVHFDIPASSEPPVRATLQLYATGGDKTGVTVSVASNNWDEQTITWDNSPSDSASPTVASGPFDGGVWISLDVTPLIPAAGPVTFALTSSTPAPMAFASREQGDAAPRLSIETAAAVVTAPANETAPSISGSAQEGQALTATAGTWSGTQPITNVYQWRRCDSTGGSCVDIAGANNTTYTLTGDDVGNTLLVAVTASNSAGSSTATTAPTSIVVAAPNDTSPPTAPTGLSASGDQATLTLAWSASSDNLAVAGYDVLLNGSRVDSVSQTSYRFSGLSCGTSYTLGVAAVDAAGNRSTVSTLTAATAACSTDTIPPSAPSNLQVSASDQASLTLAWNASSDNLAVAGYDLLLNGSLLDWASQTSYRFSGLSCGTSYTLGVAAVDAAGNRSTVSTLTSATAPCPTGPLNPCGTAVTPPTTYQHVIWIVFENKAYSEIIGSANAPYLNTLASECGVATNFFAETHPSLPNYIAMTSGSTQGITDDNPPSSHPLAVPSIFSQVASWRSLQESMPSNCALTDSYPYAVKHNPAAYYTGIRTACASFDVPLGSTPDISAAYTFVTPNLCNDMHDCSVSTGDSWLSTLLPKILGSTAYTSGSTAIVITWDEDDSSASNHVATLVIAPSVPMGTSVATTFNHYSMLRTTEELLGVNTYLGNAATAPSMRSPFHF
ncbi:MAG: DNRLRE domain-containing protein [Actinomycetota bacterium]|nr:DNRLRE domain-containing protein [Actinomycetota bacterium]